MHHARFIIFDFDGTLADSLPFLVAQMPEVARTHRFRAIPVDELESLRGLGTREILARVQLAWWRLPAVSRDFRRRMAAHADTIGLFAGVPGMLAQVAARVPVGIVTSNAEPNVQMILKDAMRLVSHGRYAAGFLGKTAHLRRICREAGVSPGEAIYVGDEVRDIEAARACGMRCAAVTWGYASRAALQAQAPDFLVTDVDSLPDMLLGRGQGPVA